MDEEYLDELMNMTIHQLVRRNLRKFLKVNSSDNVVSPSQSNSRILPETNANLVLPFITAPKLLGRGVSSSIEIVGEATIGS